MKSILLVTAFTATVMAVACNQPQNDTNRMATNSQDSLIKRGEYLVAIGGCNDCHSPKIMTSMGPVLDTTRLLSGYRGGVKPNELSTDAFAKGWILFNGENTSMATPGFTSFAANITSDTTGIGAWKYEQFKTALTKGKWKGLEGSRDLLPPMPWQGYANMKDEDIQALFAYLKSTRPVKNVVPAPVFAAKPK